MDEDVCVVVEHRELEMLREAAYVSESPCKPLAPLSLVATGTNTTTFQLLLLPYILPFQIPKIVLRTLHGVVRLFLQKSFTINLCLSQPKQFHRTKSHSLGQPHFENTVRQHDVSFWVLSSIQAL